MTEEKLKKLIEDTLNLQESVPNEILKSPSYMLDYKYLSSPSEFEDGDCICSNNYIQIDLYYKKKKDIDNANKLLSHALKTCHIYTDISSGYDTTTKLYRATYQFTKLESEE